MDLFPLVVLGGIAVVVGLLVLVGKMYPGSGADLLDWGPSRSYEQEIEMEDQDIEQMLEAQNAYRRRRGAEELSEEDVRASVAREEMRRLRDSD
jgi:hypothetical protein